ncbi:MAG: DNA sulfur modification protein DndB [Gallionella sp.]
MPSNNINPSCSSLALPALRGTFGDWTYYSAVVPLTELAKRVAFANEIHTNKELSELIQRELKGGPHGGRALDIASYLQNEKERFFNSLVIAVYGGAPQWVPLNVSQPKDEAPLLGEAAHSLGVLQMSGEEKLFAVDGQHRLAGMKRLVEMNEKDGAPKEQLFMTSDLVSVLFIAHRTDHVERTRRLFTTLNKTAVPVSKKERIALDENDVMAIVARRLVEGHPSFKSPRIAMHHTNNIGRDDGVALTTIGNLYDVLKILFLAQTGAKKKELEFNRPTDIELDKLYKIAAEYFEQLAVVEPTLNDYFTASDPAKICQKARHDSGGSIYFRPIGLTLMTEVAMLLKQKIPDWLELVKQLPRNLDEAPFAGTIWSHRGTIEPKHHVLCRDILLYMCGVATSRSAETLQQKLSEVIGKDTQLPNQLIR